MFLYIIIVLYFRIRMPLIAQCSLYDIYRFYVFRVFRFCREKRNEWRTRDLSKHEGQNRGFGRSIIDVEPFGFHENQQVQCEGRKKRDKGATFTGTFRTTATSYVEVIRYHRNCHVSYTRLIDYGTRDLLRDFSTRFAGRPLFPERHRSISHNPWPLSVVNSRRKSTELWIKNIVITEQINRYCT